MKRKSTETRSRSIFVCLTALVLLFTCAQPFAEKNSADELEAGIETLQAELKQLLEGEGSPEAYRQYREIQKQLREKQNKYEVETRELRERMDSLRQEEDVRQWQDRISEKRLELQRLHDQAQGEIQKRGRELHERRQAELAAIAPADVPRARALGFTPLNYPRMDGSTSTQPLGVILTCKLLGTPYQWAGTERSRGMWFMEEDDLPLIDIGGYFPRFELISFRPRAIPSDETSVTDNRLSTIINRMLTIHTGTHGAYENVINGTADIGLVARRPSPDEMKLAEEKGIELEVTPFALDAFVFIAHYKNPLENLSTQQIQSIYRGELTKWSDVGGPDQEIRPYQRNRNSGSQELMETLVMKELTMSEPKFGDLVHYGMAGPYIALTHDEWGLGYSVYYYEHYMAASPNTKLVSVDGVLPSYKTIRSRRYPYTTEVFVITHKGLSQDSPAAKLRDWLLSKEGQRVVRESGYVPLGRSSRKQ